VKKSHSSLWKVANPSYLIPVNRNPHGTPNRTKPPLQFGLFATPLDELIAQAVRLAAVENQQIARFHFGIENPPFFDLKEKLNKSLVNHFPTFGRQRFSYQQITLP
jgi:hypothetical protein